KDDDDAGAAEATDAGPVKSATPVVPTYHPPTVDPKAEAACRAAEAAASRDDIAEAKGHFARCEGPQKPIARAAVEQAEIRASHRVQPHPTHHPTVVVPPCKGRHCPKN